MNPKYRPIMVIVVTLILIICAVKFNIGKSCKGFNCLGFPQKNLWKVSDVYHEDKNNWSGLISHPDYMIRLNKAGAISLQKADENTKVASMNTKGLFDTARSPYAGEISDRIVCPENLKPKEEDIKSTSGVQINYMSSHLNERMQYGACLENQIAYKVYSGMFYCSNNLEWYQMEIIVEKNSAKEDDFYKKLFLMTGC